MMIRLFLWTFVCLFSMPHLVQAGMVEEEQSATSRALLIGIDDFVTQESTYPSSTNNVYAMQSVFQKAIDPFEVLLTASEPISTVERLQEMINEAFSHATADDVSYLYISTHGVYDPLQGPEPYLLLSDGITEEKLTPALLHDALSDILGTKVLLIDACNSGAFIGKGMVQASQTSYFEGEDFKVITSSGAMEESWYWSDSSQAQGAFYFSQIMAQGMSPTTGFASDQNRDGQITLAELYDYLLQNHAASTPQVYPQVDDFVVFAYDTQLFQSDTTYQSPIMDIAFSGTTLSPQNPEITIEFVAIRPVRVAYQIVYQQQGKWDFDSAQLIYDTAERFTAFGDLAGAVSAGHKTRTLQLGVLPEDSYGYALVQVVTIDAGKLTVHAGRVLCIPPTQGNLGLAVSTSHTEFTPGIGKELSVFVAHDFPCVLSVSVVDESGQIVHRLSYKAGTRPIQLQPNGSLFYWDATLKDGTFLPQGTYRIVVEATLSTSEWVTESLPFTIQDPERNG